MFSNDKNVETIGQLVETIKHYIELQKEYLKLDVVDKVVRLLTAFTITLVLLGLITIVLIYLSFAAAFALGNWLGMVWGFCIVAAFYILLLLLFVANRHQWIEKPLVRFLASLLLK